MLAKIWKKICIAILIIACLFNIVTKLVGRVDKKTSTSSNTKYQQEQQIEKNTK